MVYPQQNDFSYKAGMPTKCLYPTEGPDLVPKGLPDYITYDFPISRMEINDLVNLAMDCPDNGLYAPDQYTQRIYESVLARNKLHWNFNITGMYQAPRIVKYSDAPDGHWIPPHADYTFEDLSKIGVSILLQKAALGAELKGRWGNILQDTIGQATLIPGYAMHSVPQAITGTRIVLLAWLAGPEWI